MTRKANPDVVQRILYLMPDCIADARRQGFDGAEHEFIWTPTDLAWIAEQVERWIGRKPHLSEWHAAGNFPWISDGAPYCEPDISRKVAAALREAATIIDHGWARGDYALNAAQRPVDPNAYDATCFCASGAIARATYGTYLREDVSDIFAAYLYGTKLRLKVAPTAAIAQWNDSPDRTAVEVATAMRDCASRVEAGEL